MIKDIVANRIKSLCAERKISYTKLARDAGLTPSTVYSLLDPKRREVTINTIKLICDGLGITIKDFFDSPEFDSLEQEMY